MSQASRISPPSEVKCTFFSLSLALHLFIHVLFYFYIKFQPHSALNFLVSFATKQDLSYFGARRFFFRIVFLGQETEPDVVYMRSTSGLPKIS